MRSCRLCFHGLWWNVETALIYFILYISDVTHVCDHRYDYYIYELFVVTFVLVFQRKRCIFCLSLSIPNVVLEKICIVFSKLVRRLTFHMFLNASQQGPGLESLKYFEQILTSIIHHLKDIYALQIFKKIYFFNCSKCSQL